MNLIEIIENRIEALDNKVMERHIKILNGADDSYDLQFQNAKDKAVISELKSLLKEAEEL